MNRTTQLDRPNLVTVFLNMARGVVEECRPTIGRWVDGPAGFIYFLLHSFASNKLSCSRFPSPSFQPAWTGRTEWSSSGWTGSVFKAKQLLLSRNILFETWKEGSEEEGNLYNFNSSLVRSLELLVNEQEKVNSEQETGTGRDGVCERFDSFRFD